MNESSSVYIASDSVSLKHFYESIKAVFHWRYADEMIDIYVKNNVSPQEFIYLILRYGRYATGNTEMESTISELVRPIENDGQLYSAKGFKGG